MTSLIVMIPTRGRRALAERCLKSYTDTVSLESTELVVISDADDQHTYEGMDWGPASTAVLNPRAESLSQLLNETASALVNDFDVLMQVGDDCVFVTPGWDKILLDALEDMGGSGWVYPDDKRRNDVPEIWMTSADVVKALGWFCPPAVKHYYCVVPETLILTSALEWIPAGKLNVGDELVGVDEFPEGHCDRKFRRSTVLAAPRRQTQCVTVFFEDGREVTCSEEHMWLTRHPGWRDSFHRRAGGTSSYGWVESARLRPGDKIASPLRTWEAETSFEAGWLAGMFDGEGTCCRTLIKGRRSDCFNTRLEVAQNPGPVLDRLEVALGALGFNYVRRPRHEARDRCQILVITPRSHQMELLGRLRPTRLQADRVWEDMAIRARKSNEALATVAEVRPVGAAEVVSLKTSTGTFLANGLVSHNCDNIIGELGKRAGLIRFCPEAVIEHLHYSIPGSKARRDRVYSQAEKKFGAADLAAFRQYQADVLPLEVSLLRRQFNADVRWVIDKVA